MLNCQKISIHDAMFDVRVLRKEIEWVYVFKENFLVWLFLPQIHPIFAASAV